MQAPNALDARVGGARGPVAAVLDAPLAEAHAHGAGGAGVAGARGAVGAPAAFVDRAVAVVVEGVAELDRARSRRAGAGAIPCRPHAARTGHAALDAALADADALRARRSVVAGARLARGALAPVVDHSVAVVVEPVAELVTRRLGAAAGAPGTELDAGLHAGLGTEPALAHAREGAVARIAGLGRADRAGAGLVHPAVPVVVDAVADLLDRSGVALVAGVELDHLGVDRWSAVRRRVACAPDVGAVAAAASGRERAERQDPERPRAVSERPPVGRERAKRV